MGFKTFPSEERVALTSQIVRSSRAICSAIAERYRKRQYEKYFKSKLSDADSENSKTQLWLEFALAFKYISQEQKNGLENLSIEVGKLIYYMINNPKKFN